MATVYHYEENLDLYSALAGSKAIWDDATFIVFTRNAMSAETILKHQVLLEECIRSYGHTRISEVMCFYDL